VALLIERVLPAGGATKGDNVASVNFKACFEAFFVDTITLGNASRQGK